MEEQRNRIGEEFVNRHGTVFKIVEYYTSKNLVIEFQDSHRYRRKTTYDNCQKGACRNPFDRTVCGIGYYGVTKENEFPNLGSKETLDRYHLWASMLKRCYSDKYPTWGTCEVWERWHSFSNFLEDMPKINRYDIWENRKEDYEVHLDKDIIGSSNVYSLDTCTFAYNKDNSRERMLRVNNPNPEQQVVGVNIESGIATLYAGVRIAQRAINAKHHTGIGRCCNGKAGSAHGYRWYFKEDFLQKFPDAFYVVHSETKEEAWDLEGRSDFEDYVAN